MHDHHTFHPAYFIAAFVLCFFAGEVFAHAQNSFTKPLVTRRALFPMPLFWSAQGAITLYDAAQGPRLPMLEPMIIQVGPEATADSAVSLVFFTAGSAPGQTGYAPLAMPLGRSAPRVRFASGINDDAADQTQERTENEALFYSATNATRGVSENAIRNGGGQTRTGRAAAGSAAAPSSSGLFSQSGLQAN